MGFKSRVKKAFVSGVKRYSSSAQKELARRKAVATENRAYRSETARLVKEKRRETNRAQAIARASKPRARISAVGLQNLARGMGYGLPVPTQPKPIIKRIKRRRSSRKRRRR